jgi:hypothetical protein
VAVPVVVPATRLRQGFAGARWWGAEALAKAARGDPYAVSLCRETLFDGFRATPEADGYGFRLKAGTTRTTKVETTLLPMSDKMPLDRAPPLR